MSENVKLYRKIVSVMKEKPLDPQAYKDLVAVANDDIQRMKDTPHDRGVGISTASDFIKALLFASSQLEKVIKETGDLTLYKCHKDTLWTLAPYDFESFLFYMEWERAPEKRFYMPRRKQLKIVVTELQNLAEDKLDLLAISLPPGVGKSTLALFFITWLGGKNPDQSILIGSHNSEFIRGSYDETLRLIDPVGEYLYMDVFPRAFVVNTNAKNCRIDINRPKRFETFEFTTIGSGNAGLYRAQQLLYCDDLVSGIDVAMSKDRLDSVWREYSADLRQRKQGRCKELHIATRWSVHDVIGRLERLAGLDPRSRFLTVPALDKDGKSNFDYPYNLGFSTAMFEEQKRLLDDATWRAVYMNEPIEREGQLYSVEELRRYSDLPDLEPDAVLSLGDLKDSGDDYCVLPVLYQYGEDFYVYDCVCDNGKPEVVDAKLINCLQRNNVQMAQFESNNIGRRVAEKIQAELRSRGSRCHITTKFSKSNKETRIIVNSPFVKEHFLFLTDSSEHMTPEYRKMLDMLVTYTMYGRNKHDDVPDAFAMASEYVQNFTRRKVEVFKRPF